MVTRRDGARVALGEGKGTSSKLRPTAARKTPNGTSKSSEIYTSILL